MIHKQCKFQCCKRTFLPLELAFARTLHRFQGLSAGPVDEGKIPNMFGVIVCDPDIRAVEGRATSFFYTMLSRATTLGDENGLNSAIYFTGPHLTKERIQNLTLKTNSNQTLQNVKRRTEWVHHLKRNTRDTTEQCQSMSASPITFLVLNLRAYYYRVDQSKERTEYMCVTAEECSCSRHV
jgi:hypothetical protein